MVRVAEDVAACAGGLAVRGRTIRIVEHVPPGNDRGRFRIVESDLLQQFARRRVEHLHGAIDVREHVELGVLAVLGIVQQQPGGPAENRQIARARDFRVELFADAVPQRIVLQVRR